jgi:hypothetical protein
MRVLIQFRSSPQAHTALLAGEWRRRPPPASGTPTK